MSVDAALATFRADRPYVRSARDEALEVAFERVLDSLNPGSDEARCLVLTGLTGAGKTRALQRLFSQRFHDYGNRGCRVVSLMTPSPATLRVIGREVLRAIGYPLRSDPREAIVWEIVREKLNGGPVAVLHFDEFQHVAQEQNSHQRQVALNILKSLLISRRPVGLVLSGLPDILDLLDEDHQVRRRCVFVEFGSLHPTDDVDIIRDVVARCAGRHVRIAEGDQLAETLMRAGGRQLGRCIDVLRDTVEEAIRSASALDAPMLEHRDNVARYSPPSGDDRAGWTSGRRRST